ncbi:MAG TPA: hypothetical protein VF647_15490 [Longimicrobium sp.]|jgi:hypothetical protein
MPPLPPSNQPDPIRLAQNHLERARRATSKDPVDWTDLTVYGFYCLEVALKAAAEHLGTRFATSHARKAQIAMEFATNHNLPDVSTLLTNLNEARKATGYGDVSIPPMDSDDLLAQLEGYVSAVVLLLAADDDPDDGG